MAEKLDFLKGTQASYNALTSKNENTFYRTDKNNLYLGDIHLNKQNVVFGTCATSSDLSEKIIVITDSSWTITEGAILFVKFAETNSVSIPTFKINDQSYPVYTARGNEIADLDGLNPEIYAQGGDETQILSYVYHNNAFYCQADEPESAKMVLFTYNSCSESFIDVAALLMSQQKVYFFLEIEDAEDLPPMMVNLTFCSLIDNAGLLFACHIPGMGEGILILTQVNSVVVNIIEPGSITIGTNTWSEESGSNIDFTPAVQTIATTIANTAYNKISSRGEQLITNGNALLGNNTNFTSFLFDGTQANGTNGSFTRYMGSASKGTVFTDEYFPVNPNLTYKLSLDAKTKNGLSSLYTFLAFYDANKNLINVKNHVHNSASTTTLAKELKKGDTQVYLTDVSGWSTTYSYGRFLLIWDQTNQYGYTYPAGTYTQHSLTLPAINNKLDPAALDTSNKTVTLSSAYNGTTIPAGTPVSQGGDAATFKYIAAVNAIPPTNWQSYEGFIGGIDYSGTNVPGTFPPGAAYCRVGFLWNNNGTNDQTWITNVSVTALPAIATGSTLGVVKGGGNVTIGTDGKLNIDGAASTIAKNNLSANLAIITDGNGKIAASGVTSTELGYLSGTTKNVQTQLDEKAHKKTGVYYIEGTGSTAGTWLGSHADITAYYPGLMIAYKVGIAAASTTKLNINNLGAVSVVANASTAVSTRYPVNSIVFLVYTTDSSGTSYWKVSDYDSDKKAASANKVDTKLFLTGATTQSSSGQTSYSNINCYIGDDNNLYSNGEQVVIPSILEPLLAAKMDKENPVGEGTFSMNRKADTPIGSYSTTLGYNNVACGSYSLAAGYNSYAFGTNSTTLGRGLLVNMKLTGDANATSYKVSNADFGFLLDYRIPGQVIYCPSTKTYAKIISQNLTTATITLDKTLSDSALSSVAAIMPVGATYGTAAFSTGYESTASGNYSFAGGYRTLASGSYSFTHGYWTNASGQHAFAVGDANVASGSSSFAEGEYTYATAKNAHAEGSGTYASSANQHVAGKYNIIDQDGTYAYITGNGTVETRANIHTLDWNGNVWFKGNVYVGGNDQASGSKLATVADINTALSSVLTYKGTKETTANLPTSGNATGDVWNITTACAASGILPAVNAGDNVAWNGSTWDVLAGIIDLSNYLTGVSLDGTALAVHNGVANIPLASGQYVPGIIKTKSTVSSILSTDYIATPVIGGSPYYGISKLRVGASGAVANAIVNKDPYLTTSDGGTYRSQVRLVGGGATTIKSTSSGTTGQIEITSVDTTYTFAEGTTDGAFSVTPNGGTAQSVSIHGLNAAAYKGVVDSTSAAAIGTGTNIPTERDIYYGLPTINNSHTYTSSTAIFAPTSGGTATCTLVANGATSAPTWTDTLTVTAGTGANVKGTLSLDNAVKFQYNNNDKCVDIIFI